MILELILVSGCPFLSAGGQRFCSEDDEGAQNPQKSQAGRQASPDSTSGLDVSQGRAFRLARGCRESPCPKGISLWVWIPQPAPHLWDLTTSNGHTSQDARVWPACLKVVLEDKTGRGLGARWTSASIPRVEEEATPGRGTLRVSALGGLPGGHDGFSPGL